MRICFLLSSLSLPQSYCLETSCHLGPGGVSHAWRSREEKGSGFLTLWKTLTTLDCSFNFLIYWGILHTVFINKKTQHLFKDYNLVCSDSCINPCENQNSEYFCYSPKISMPLCNLPHPLLPAWDKHWSAFCHNRLVFIFWNLYKWNYRVHTLFLSEFFHSVIILRFIHVSIAHSFLLLSSILLYGQSTSV